MPIVEISDDGVLHVLGELLAGANRTPNLSWTFWARS